MNNSQMKPNRFLKKYKGKKRMEFVKAVIKAGLRVMTVCNCPRVYSKVSQFKLDDSGTLYVQRGRGWDCLDFTSLKAVE